MAEKHLKKCSASLIIREMQIKTTLRFHLTPVRMAKIKNPGNRRWWWGCGERETLLHCLVGLQACTTTLKISLVVTQKIGHSTTEGSSNTTPGHISEDVPTCNKGMCSTMFIAALFIIARSWKEPRCSLTEEWIQIMCYTYTMKYYAAIKNNEFMEFVDK